MALTATQIKDLATGTLQRLGRLRFNQIASTLQNYEVLPRIMKREKVQFDDGIGIRRTFMVDHSNAARNVGMYEPDAVNVADVLKTTDIPWRHTTTNYAFSRRELAMNRGISKIVDLLKVRRTDALLALAELMEVNFWTKPVDSNDKVTPFGVPYWVVQHATTGFNGGAPTGFALGSGNLLHARWQNFTAEYTNITKADLIKLMRKARRQTNWISPVDVPDFRRGNGQRFRIYVGETVLEAMEDLGEAANENLGRDLAPMDGAMAFKRFPIIWSPKLDAASDESVYMIDYNWFSPVFLKGEYLHEEEPEKAANQHTVFEVHVDLTWNLLCTNRRTQAVIKKA